MVLASKAAIGFIGLGNMGRPMAKNLMKAGYQLVVYDLAEAPLKELERMGAKVARSAKEVADNADLIITSLPGPSEVRDAILGKRDESGMSAGVIEGIRPGKIVIDMTTNAPSVSRELAEQVRSKGGEMLDATVSGSVKPAAEGTLTIMAGGNRQVVQKVTPILQTMGKRVWYVGGNGMACSMKLALNAHLATMMISFLECLALGVKSGLDPALMLDIFNNSVMKSYVSEIKGPKILSADWTTEATLSMLTKDARLATEWAKEIKIPLPMLGAAKEIYDAALANGKGNLDMTAVTMQVEQMADVKITRPA